MHMTESDTECLLKTPRWYLFFGPRHVHTRQTLAFCQHCVKFRGQIVPFQSTWKKRSQIKLFVPSCAVLRGTMLHPANSCGLAPSMQTFARGTNQVCASFPAN